MKDAKLHGLRWLQVDAGSAGNHGDQLTGCCDPQLRSYSAIQQNAAAGWRVGASSQETRRAAAVGAVATGC